MGKAFRGKELMDTIKPLSWIWEPFIPRGFITILASRGGVGKTGFSLWLANRIKSEGMEVLYVDYEACGPHHKQRIEEWGLSFVNDIYFFGDVGQTCGVADENELAAVVEETKPDLIILDSLTSLLQGRDINNRSEMAKLAKVFTNIAIKNNAGLLVLAHNRKNQMQDDGNTLDSISGSAAISDMARSVLMMDFESGGDKKGRIIRQKKSNFAIIAPDLRLTFDFDGIHDVSFMIPPPDPSEVIQDTGIKADKFRAIAIESLKNGMDKKETIARLKEFGANPTECTRAVQTASEQLNIKWAGAK